MTATSKPAMRSGSSVGSVAAGGQRRGQPVVGDVLDVGVAGGQALDPVVVEVEADHVVADLHGRRARGRPT